MLSHTQGKLSGWLDTPCFQNLYIRQGFGPFPLNIELRDFDGQLFAILHGNGSSTSIAVSNYNQTLRFVKELHLSR